MSDLMVRWACGLVAAGMIVALFSGGSQPGAAGLFPAPWDKVVHVGYFLVLTLLMFRARPQPPSIVMLLAIAIGAADELNQMSVPWRDASWADFFADTAGVLAATALTRFVPGSRTRYTNPVHEPGSLTRR